MAPEKLAIDESIDGGNRRSLCPLDQACMSEILSRVVIDFIIFLIHSLHQVSYLLSIFLSCCMRRAVGKMHRGGSGKSCEEAIKS